MESKSAKDPGSGMRLWHRAAAGGCRATLGHLRLLTGTDRSHCSLDELGSHKGPSSRNPGSLLPKDAPTPGLPMLTATLTEAFPGTRTQVPKSLVARAAARRSGPPGLTQLPSHTQSWWPSITLQSQTQCHLKKIPSPTCSRTMQPY